MSSDGDTISIEQAARLLGRSLRREVPHVVGVSLRRSKPGASKLDLYVDIDSEEAAKHIPRTFGGYEVHVRRVGTPKFAARHAESG